MLAFHRKHLALTLRHFINWKASWTSTLLHEMGKFGPWNMSNISVASANNGEEIHCHCFPGLVGLFKDKSNLLMVHLKVVTRWALKLALTFIHSDKKHLQLTVFPSSSQPSSDSTIG